MANDDLIVSMTYEDLGTAVKQYLERVGKIGPGPSSTGPIGMLGSLLRITPKENRVAFSFNPASVAHSVGGKDG